MRLRAIAQTAALALLVGLAPEAQAQSDTLKKLQDFKTTGTPLDLKLIDQGGEKAAALRANLERVKLPPGFKIDRVRPPRNALLRP